MLNEPIDGMAATASGDGYWLAASDGGIFSFGNAIFRGSAVGERSEGQVVGMAADPASGGYWILRSDGGIVAGGAPLYRTT